MRAMIPGVFGASASDLKAHLGKDSEGKQMYFGVVFLPIVITNPPSLKTHPDFDI